MADARSYIQPPADTGVGKKVEALAVTVPAGTQLTAADGTVTTLTADATYFRQVAVIGDPTSPTQFAGVDGEAGRGALRADQDMLLALHAIIEELRNIRVSMVLITQ